MLQLDRHDPRPVYEQVAEGLEMQIARGILTADTKLPSVRQLAVELSVNPNTIQKAYGELLNKGVIYTVRGLGNFVSADSGIKEKRLKDIYEQMLSLIEQAKEMGATQGEIKNLIEMLSEVTEK